VGPAARSRRLDGSHAASGGRLRGKAAAIHLEPGAADGHTRVGERRDGGREARSRQLLARTAVAGRHGPTSLRKLFCGSTPASRGGSSSPSRSRCDVQRVGPSPRRLSVCRRAPPRSTLGVPVGPPPVHGGEQVLGRAGNPETIDGLRLSRRPSRPGRRSSRTFHAMATRDPQRHVLRLQSWHPANAHGCPSTTSCVIADPPRGCHQHGAPDAVLAGVPGLEPRTTETVRVRALLRGEPEDPRSAADADGVSSQIARVGR
jgi:hypothetical protein